MSVLAVMARYRVTQGAGWWVPISGCSMAYLPGQVTCLAYLSTGAAKSEPSEAPPLSSDRATSMRCCTCGGWLGGVPGVQVVPGVDQRCAHCPGWSECIYGVLLRLGQGRQGQERCQKQCQNQCQ